MRLRRLLLIVLVLLLLLPVGGFVFLAVQDFGPAKAELDRRLEAALGREVVIEEGPSVALGLRPTVAVRGVSVANAPWGTQPQMLQAERALLQLAIAPLLRGRIEIDRVELENAALLLERDAAGVPNWRFAGAERDTSAEPAVPDEPLPEGEPEAGGALPLVRDVTVSGTEIIYRAAPDREPLTARVDRLTLQAEGPDAPLLLALDGAVQELPFVVAGELGSLAALALPTPTIPISLDVRMADIALVLAGTVDDPAGAAALDLEIGLSAPNLLVLAALLEGEGFANVMAEGEQLAELIARARDLQGGMRLIGPARAPALADATLALDFGGVALTAEGEVADLAAAQGIEFLISARGALDPAFVEALGLAPLTDGAVEVEMLLTGDPEELELLADPVLLAGSDLRLQLAFRDGAERPSLQGSLSGGRLLLPRFLDDGDGEEDAQDGETQRLFSQDPLPLDGLRAVDLDLAVELGTVVAGELAIDEVAATMTSTAGNARIEPLRLLLAGSAVDAALALDARAGREPVLDLRLDVPAWRVGPLAAVFMASSPIEAEGEFTAALTSRGVSMAAMAGNLDGGLSAVLADGRLDTRVLEGSLPRGVREVVTGATGRYVALRCAVLDLPVAAGQGTIRSLVAVTPVASVVGVGGLDLANETLEVTLQPRSALPGIDLDVPVRLSGWLGAPEVEIDSARALGTAASGITRALGIGGAGGGGNGGGGTGAGTACASAVVAQPTAGPSLAPQGLELPETPDPGGEVDRDVDRALDTLDDAAGALRRLWD